MWSLKFCFDDEIVEMKVNWRLSAKFDQKTDEQLALRAILPVPAPPLALPPLPLLILIFLLQELPQLDTLWTCTLPLSFNQHISKNFAMHATKPAPAPSKIRILWDDLQETFNLQIMVVANSTKWTSPSILSSSSSSSIPFYPPHSLFVAHLAYHYRFIGTSVDFGRPLHLSQRRRLFPCVSWVHSWLKVRIFFFSKNVIIFHIFSLFFFIILAVLSYHFHYLSHQRISKGLITA